MRRRAQIAVWMLVMLAPAGLTAACGDDEQILTILTHDSFQISEDVIAAFEEEHEAEVRFLQSGDAVEVLNQAILTKDNPLADLLFGVDDVTYLRGVAEDIFEPYESPDLANVDAEFLFDPSHQVTPIDYGYVLFNYQKAALKKAGLQPPARLEDLTDPIWRGRIAVQDPNTSSPGLQFMLASVSYFGETGDYPWLEFWRDLRANDVIVTSGWEDAYYTQFAQYGGPAWIVNSYATSPPAEVIFAEEPLQDSPTANLILPGASYLQIEAAGVLKGSEHPELAQRFIDYMLGQRFQEDIPLNMFVYPVRHDAAIPEVFEQFAAVPSEPAQIDPATVAAQREAWLDQWTQVMTR